MDTKRPPGLTRSSSAPPMFSGQTRTVRNGGAMQPIEPILRRQGVGFATEGTGFYAWDVELRPLTVWAVALHQAARPARRDETPEPAGPDQKWNEYVSPKV